MASGVKRSAHSGPEPRNKRSRPSAKDGKLEADAQSVPDFAPMCPVAEGEDHDNDDDDDDDDEDNQEMRHTADQFTKLAAQLKKKNSWPRIFGKALDDRQTTILQRLEDAAEEIESDKQSFEERLLPLLRTALAPIDENDAPPASADYTIKVAFTAANGQSYCERLADLIAESHKLVAAYKTAAGREKQSSRLAEIKWTSKRDKETARGAIEAGKRLVREDIGWQLADKNQEVRGRSGLTREDEQKGKLVISRGGDMYQKEKVTVGWGNVAHDVANALRKLEFVSNKP